MRTLLPTLLLLSTALAALPAAVQAQEAPPAPPPLLEDAAGDVAATILGSPGPQGGQWDAIDLVSLAVQEDPHGFLFDVHVAGLGGDGPNSAYGNLQVQFAFNGADFRLNLYRSVDNGAYFGSLYRSVDGGEDGYPFVRNQMVDRDLAAGRVWTWVDRFDLADGDGLVPGRGDELSNLRIDSYSSLGSPLGWGTSKVGDRMPDGDASATLAVLFGGGESHGATLATDRPWRSSNGEATTYLYEVTARHDGADAARFRLSVDNVPDGWTVVTPGALLDIPAGATVEIPVYVTTTFKHQHGAASAFQVHLHEDGGESWSMLELGVDFLAVPQPAGHHPDLWLHSNYWSEQAAVINPPLGGTNGYTAMNTLQEDPADVHKPVLGYSDIPTYTGMYGTARFMWSVCLEPALQLGLDFDLAGTGSMQLPFSTTRPMPGAVLSGRLIHLAGGDPVGYCFPSNYKGREQTVLATFESEAKDLMPNAPVAYDVSFTPTPESDFIVGQEGAGLVLELTVSSVGMPLGGVGGVSLEPGGHLLLPLNEYHDPIHVVAPTDAPQVAGFVPEAAPAKDAPAGAVPALLAALAGLALLRRRAA